MPTGFNFNAGRFVGMKDKDPNRVVDRVPQNGTVCGLDKRRPAVIIVKSIWTDPLVRALLQGYVSSVKPAFREDTAVVARINTGLPNWKGRTDANPAPGTGFSGNRR